MEYTEDELLVLGDNLVDDFYLDSEFQQVAEVSGVATAAAYVIAKNCITEVAQAQDDDWLMEIIRHAYQNMSSEGQAKFSEQGF